MYGYLCKYTPIELLSSFSLEGEKIEEGKAHSMLGDSLMHSNICSYIKSILDKCLDDSYDFIILTSCCDSVRRLYDVLLDKGKKTYLLPIPRKSTEEAVELFSKSLLKLKEVLEEENHVAFNKERFLQILKEKGEESSEKSEVNEDINLAFLGGRISASLCDELNECHIGIYKDFTCYRNKKITLDLGSDLSLEDLFKEYARALLSQFPCMRMEDTKTRMDSLLDIKNADGLIYHSVKFCDIYSYEYPMIKNEAEVPILKIESDYGNNSEGQLKTRIEAFAETLKEKKQGPNIIKNKVENNISNKNFKKAYVLGIDSGSTSTNAVIMDLDKNIYGSSIVKTGPDILKGAIDAKEEVFKESKIDPSEIVYTIATGYGRVSIPYADNTVTEISCHGKGAHYLNKDVRTIIDIGGQDSKVIRLNDKGEVVDFAMNDKCAAGTGRFLDTMSKSLQIPLKEMGKKSLEYKKEVSISSMCTVFAESEVVSLVAKKIPLPDILNAINLSISTRVVSLVDRVGRRDEFMMTGGVAKNVGVVTCLSKKLSCKIAIPKEPQIVGAIGAALTAIEEYQKIHM